MNKAVVTRRSDFVSTRPMAFATKENMRKNTSAWKRTAFLPVRPSLNATLEPSVRRMIPGLSNKKSADGTDVFLLVISGSMLCIIYIYYIINLTDIFYLFFRHFKTKTYEIVISCIIKYTTRKSRIV